ncbi:MAG: putative glycosyltransferase like family 2 [Prokaryotic dsDNA virus sp.]|nr:MAG: putative glycosyltransferase like family 2 [Prokaryotic dsDNA virus sp.]
MAATDPIYCRHIVYLVGPNTLPNALIEEMSKRNFLFLSSEQEYRSIGHYHNEGFNRAETDWVMKLDVDALPHEEYFQAMLDRIIHAEHREWFNGGMLYLHRGASAGMLQLDQLPITRDRHHYIARNIKQFSSSSYQLPAATNFACRKKDYFSFGGTDDRFRGWGWEDYMVIYMLERLWRGVDPLAGEVNFHNVTRRCRDEIGRPRSAELYRRDDRLALLHHWHPVSKDPKYKNEEQSNRNKQILLERILNSRK